MTEEIPDPEMHGEPPSPPPDVVAAPRSTIVMRERVTCPECGATQEISLNRRDAADFCHSCDYPLFWAPALALRDSDGLLDGEGLRRLPGTAGRSTLAFATCPHCAELNPIMREECVRCGQPMHPVAPPPPPPPPVYVPPPPPPVVVEPEEAPWWAWALLGFTLVAIVVFIILLLTHTIG